MNGVHGDGRGVFALWGARHGAEHRTYFYFSAILDGRCCKKGDIVAFLTIFYASKHRFYSFTGPLGALRLGCGLRRWQLRAYCAEAAKKGRVAHGCCAFVVCLVLSFWPMR